MAEFQNLKNCDKIKNHYAEVLFGLYKDVTAEWTKEYHAIADTYPNQYPHKKYIRFTGDYNEETHSSSLQFRSAANTQLFPDDTLIFAAYLDYKTRKVSDTAIMFFYNKPDEYTLITKKDNHFTTQEFNGLASENEVIRQYGNGGGSGFIIGFGANATEKSKAERFKEISLVSLMKNKAFAAGRALGQRSTSAKKKAAVIANGRRTAKRYKAEIDWAGGYKEMEFDSGVDCFKYFSGANGGDKIFNNLMAFSRAMAKSNGKFEYHTDKMNVVICALAVKPTSKIYKGLNPRRRRNVKYINIYLTSRLNSRKTINKKPRLTSRLNTLKDRLPSRVFTQKDNIQKTENESPKPRGLAAKAIKDEENYRQVMLSLSDDISKQINDENALPSRVFTPQDNDQKAGNESPKPGGMAREAQMDWIKNNMQNYDKKAPEYKWMEQCETWNYDPGMCYTFEEYMEKGGTKMTNLESLKSTDDIESANREKQIKKRMKDYEHFSKDARDAMEQIITADPYNDKAEKQAEIEKRINTHGKKRP